MLVLTCKMFSLISKKWIFLRRASNFLWKLYPYAFGIHISRSLWWSLISGQRFGALRQLLLEEGRFYMEVCTGSVVIEQHEECPVRISESKSLLGCSAVSGSARDGRQNAQRGIPYSRREHCRLWKPRCSSCASHPWFIFFGFLWDVRWQDQGCGLILLLRSCGMFASLQRVLPGTVLTVLSFFVRQVQDTGSSPSGGLFSPPSGCGWLKISFLNLNFWAKFVVEALQVVFFKSQVAAIEVVSCHSDLFLRSKRYRQVGLEPSSSPYRIGCSTSLLHYKLCSLGGRRAQRARLHCCYSYFCSCVCISLSLGVHEWVDTIK